MAADLTKMIRSQVTAVATMTKIGRPVLIGTRSLHRSEELARIFDAAGQEYRLLNARQDAEEADIIREAGKRGQVTIATNMAGRGADIPLARIFHEKNSDFDLSH